MKFEIRRALPQAAVALCLAAPLTPAAAQQTQDHAGHHPPADAKEAPQADGEVRRIDKAQGKLTLRHGEIKWLDMPPMTMVFRVKDAAWLDQFKVGDKVSFRAEKIDGAYTVTSIEPAR